MAHWREFDFRTLSRSGGTVVFDDGSEFDYYYNGPWLTGSAFARPGHYFTDHGTHVLVVDGAAEVREALADQSPCSDGGCTGDCDDD